MIVSCAERGCFDPCSIEIFGARRQGGLVAWTAGNISARVPGKDLMVIEPSGVSYRHLGPESMGVTDLHGRLVEAPSRVL